MRVSAINNNSANNQAFGTKFRYLGTPDSPITKRWVRVGKEFTKKTKGYRGLVEVYASSNNSLTIEKMVKIKNVEKLDFRIKLGEDLHKKFMSLSDEALVNKMVQFMEM